MIFQEKKRGEIVENEITNIPDRVNPRHLLKEKNGKDLILKLLQVRSAYLVQSFPLIAVCNAILRGTPIMLEGVRGGGKTALAEALAESCGLKVFYLACMSGLRLEDILFSWDKVAQDVHLSQQKTDNVWTLPFLVMGEVLAAYHYASLPETNFPPVLIIDEIDKLDEYTQDTLLQVLARNFANIPRLRPESRVGIFPERKHELKDKMPIVILTSNNMRKGVSSPLRSRARFAYIEPPTKTETIKILLAKLHKFGFDNQIDLLKQVSRLIYGISGRTLEEMPALREYEEFLLTLCDKKVEKIDTQILYENMDTLVKSKKDVAIFKQNIEALIIDYVENNDPEMEVIVEKAIEEYNEASLLVRGK